MAEILVRTFVADYSSLKEDYRVPDLVDVSRIAKDFAHKLERAQPNSIIGLVGPFGSGKSTMLHKVSKSIANDKWVQFDAWQFPDRSELWEGFVLTFAKFIDETTYKDAKKIIDGAQNDDKKTLINTLGDIPGAAVIKNFNHFFATSPARRTIEIQDILSKIIEKKCKGQKIYVVVEDIDRSGDAGVFFLETLRYFINNIAELVDIKVIVPIAEKNFIKNEDSFLKCLDIVDFFPLHTIKLSGFFKTVLRSDLGGGTLGLTQITEYFEELIKTPDMTMRKIKSILRKADLNYQNQLSDGHEPDWRMSVMFETAKHLSESGGGSGSSFDNFRARMYVSGGSVFAALMDSVAQNKRLTNGDRGLRSGSGFKLITRTSTIDQHPSAPYIINDPFHDGSETHFCMDFYLDY